MTSRILVVAALACCLAGCSGIKPIGGSPSITVIDGAKMPAPDGGDPDSQSSVYRVGPRDKLLVDVFGFEELKSREIETDANAEIALPLAGRVAAAGLTLAELETAIADKLRAAYVRDPKVSVNPVDVRSSMLTVDGSVREPGRYPVVGKTTLIQAVAMASGVSDLARLEDVVVFRTVAGRRMVALYNLAAIRRGVYDDPILFDDDVVIVGESSGRRLFQSIVQAGTIISAPLVAVLGNN